MQFLKAELERIRKRMQGRPPLHCTDCLDTKRAADGGPCSCASLLSHLRYADVPLHYQRARLGELHAQLNPKAVEFIEHNGTLGMVVLAGQPGRGKSWLAAAWLASLVNAQRRGAWVNISMLLRRLLDADKSDQRRLWQYALRPIAVLDDLGHEHPSEWSRAKVHELLEDRVSRSLHTCVTLNLSREQLVSRYSDATVSRLLSGRLFVLNGVDLRTQR